ncbi:recombinase family protein [Arthrobacter sulfonylureivorans]|uniref:Recombinase family protein n=1 Tax=Arthrobacter sulfonylureivorans TaxID=2486855 RepID=A0ABY3WEX9_9MICC|nr:recombinase family protein [Arthrobacter sulfonylureivorans]UNK47123.1 recombinase family protein [Arthrobacter sulfonylureivorans]
MRVAIYVRQSQDKAGNAAAVERQEAACRKLADAKGWTGPALYQDNDKSASSGVRPAFGKLLADIEAGRVDALLVWHLDRLTRTIRDLTQVIEAGKARRVNIASVHGVSLDLGDPTGVAVATILTAIAAMEVQHKGQRQKAANLQRAKAGHAHWIRRPFGYRRDGHTVTADPAEAEALRDAAARILAGESLSAIVREWNAAGIQSTVGKPWNVTSLRRALLNPRNTGRRLYNGEDLGEGAWPAILDADTLQSLETKLTDPRRRTAPDDLNAKYLLSGIALCGKCGKKMFASPAKKNGREWMMYRCFGGYCMTRRLDKVDEVVEAVITGILARPDAAARFGSGDEAAALQQRATDLRDRRDALAAMLADGLLSPGAVRKQAGRLSSELADAEASLAAVDALNPAAAVIAADDVDTAWLALPLGDKRRIIRTLASVTVLPAGKGVRFDPSQVQVVPKGSAS